MCYQRNEPTAPSAGIRWKESVMSAFITIREITMGKKWRSKVKHIISEIVLEANTRQTSG